MEIPPLTMYGFYGLLGYLPFLGFFYFIVVPIWLIIVTRRVNATRRELEALRSGKPIQPSLAEKMQPPQAPTVPDPQTALRQAGIPPSPEDRAEEFRKTQKEIPAQKVAAGKSFEERVGEHWFQWIGIAALILALVFFLKWAFDNEWIGPVGRTVIGYVFAGCAIVAGDRMRKKYGVWSLAFTGGGALASYIVTWVALHTYQLFPSAMAMALYILTTVIICLLAGYYRTIALAAFGIIGGLLTPLLTGEEGSIIGLLTYVLILDIGILALGHFRQWRVLNALTFIGTLLWELYAHETGDIARGHALMFMAAFGSIYLLVPAIYNIRKHLKSELGDLIILIGNGIAHFALLLWWLEETPSIRETYDAPIALGFSLLFLLVSYGIYQKNKEDTPLVLGGLSLTVLFASLAIPMQLGEVWTTFAWSIEAAFLLWIGLELKDKRIQLFAWPVMGAAYIWYLFVPTGENVAVVLLHSGFYLFLFWVILFVGIAWLALENDEKSSESLLPFALVGGVVLLLALFFNIIEETRSSLDFVGRLIEAVGIIGGSYFVLWQAKRKWHTLSHNEKQGFTALGICVQVITLSYFTYEFREAIDNKKLFASAQKPIQIKQVGTSLLWGGYGALTLIIGFTKNWKSIRIFSIVVLLITIAKLTLIDLSILGTGARIVGFSVLGVLFIGASFLYQHHKEKMKSFFVESKENPQAPSPPSSPPPPQSNA